jgi:hypothetical protein
VRDLAFRVNGQPIYRDEVAAMAAREKVSEKAAERMLVELEAVAQEARRQGFPAAGGEDRESVTRRYLDAAYVPETLCVRFTEREIDEYYQSVFRPEWPADVYTGEVIEVRCCPEAGAGCDSPEVRLCLEENVGVLPELARVGREWGRGVRDAAGLAAAYPLLRVTDFGFLEYPGLAPEVRKARTLFDGPTIAAIERLVPGEVSGVLASSLGYHVVRLRGLRRAITRSSPEFLVRAREEICKARVEQTRRHFVATLAGYAVISREGGRPGSEEGPGPTGRPGGTSP